MWKRYTRSVAVPPPYRQTPTLALEVPEIQSRHAGSLSAFPALEGSGHQVPISQPAWMLHVSAIYGLSSIRSMNL
jgi:hypothetical protein